MNSLTEVLQHYYVGNFTATDTVLEVLQLVTDENVDAVLSSLPVEVLGFMKEFVADYHLGIRVFNGPRPSPHVIKLVNARLGANPFSRNK
jgi:hypothetical protein